MAIFIIVILLYIIGTLINLFLLKYSRKKEYIDEDEAEVFFWISIIPIINISSFIMLICNFLHKLFLKSNFYKNILKIKDTIIK